MRDRLVIFKIKKPSVNTEQSVLTEDEVFTRGATSIGKLNSHLCSDTLERCISYPSNAGKRFFLLTL